MSEFDTAYLIYLGLLLLFIGGGLFFMSRSEIGKSLQQAMIWGLIFLGVIAAYGLKDFIAPQLFPSQGYASGDEIRFRKADDGHFYAQLQVNGVAIDFVVDTGATSLVLTQDDAERVGINVDELTFPGRASTANGMTGTERVTLKLVELGDISDRNVRASVNEGELFESLLGMEYLSRFGEIRIKGDVLTLVR